MHLVAISAPKCIIDRQSDEEMNASRYWSWLEVFLFEHSPRFFFCKGENVVSYILAYR